jgi:hypothetical protein
VVILNLAPRVAGTIFFIFGNIFLYSLSISTVDDFLCFVVKYGRGELCLNVRTSAAV